MKNKYEKYINCNFGYNNMSLIYVGTRKGCDDNACHCCKCKKNIKGLEFVFVCEEDYKQWLDNNAEEYIYGSECVKSVFGAGLRRMKVKE